MKKFMTVLLVIAVMFTFSFSTAFAANANFDKNLATRYFEIAMEDVKADGSALTYFGNDRYYIDYEILEANKALLLEAVLDYAEEVAYVQDADGIFTVLNLREEGLPTELAMELVAAQYAADKAEALAILAGLDTSSFSEKEMDAVDAHGCKTYVDHVKYEIAEAIDAINEATFTTDSAFGAYVDAKEVIDRYFDAYAGETTYNKLVVEEGYMAGSTPVGLGIYKINGFATYKTTYVDAQGALTEATIAAKKAEIASAYATYLANNTLTADQKAKAANVKKALDFLAEAGIPGINPAADFGKDVDTAVAAVATFEAAAAKLAAEVDAKGALVRDAAEVAKLVKEGTINAYWVALGAPADYVLTAGYSTIDTCLDEIEALYTGIDAEKLAFAKEVRETFVAKLLASYKTNAEYYPLEMAKVEAITAEYLEKVNAVTEFAKVDDYDTTYIGDVDATGVTVATFVEAGKLDAVATAAEVRGLSAVSSLKTVAHQYADLMNSQLKGTAKYYGIASGNYAKLDALINALVGNSEARTAKEIAALSSEAVALISTLPTVAEVEAAADAVEDAVDAIPAKITTADGAAIDAAVAANKAYKALTTVDHAEKSAIDAAKTKYAYAYNNVIALQVKNVTKTDKAAVKAILADITAFTTTYGNATVFNTAKTTLNGYLDAIQDAEAAAVTKAINAIPTISNLTEAAKATVEAARAAYDAYVAEYTDATDYDYAGAYSANDGFVADDFGYAALLAAETALGLNDNTAEKEAAAKAAQIAAIEGIKIKANSSAKKGSITVKWTVDEEVEGVKYQVYKSTKAQKGYKKAITTSKTSFKNTKNLKKGTRYFYKVRAIGEVDGVTYYSDWSNKANRIAK